MPLALPAGAALLLVSALPAQAPAAGVADRDRPDAGAGRARPAQGPGLGGDRPHLGRGRDPARRRRASSASDTTRSRCARRSGGFRCWGRSGWPGRRSPPGSQQGHPSLGAVAARDGRPAALAARPAALRAPRHRPPRVRLGPAGRAHGRDRDAAGHRLRDLPPAGRAALAARPGRPSRGRELVRAHGSDTLSFFKLRADEHYFFSPDRRGVRRLPRSRTACCCSPATRSGPTDALPGCSPSSGVRRGPRAQARRRRAPASGCCPLYEGLGLRTIYLGDEAIVEVGRVLAGGAPHPQGAPVGQPPAQGRLRGRAASRSELEPAVAAEVEEVLERGRDGAPERGFSMAMDSVHGDHGEDTLVVLARDEDRRASAASFTSSRASGARRCRCRSCAATRPRPTG